MVGCATRHEPAGPLPGEARGLYTTGFEASHFRRCGDPPGLGSLVEFDSSAAAQLQAAWRAGASSTSDGWTYYVYYVRWVLRELAEPSPPPAGTIRISNAPRHAVTRVLEVRTPYRGECGWQPGELPGVLNG